jgi:hypothetical protein
MISQHSVAAKLVTFPFNPFTKTLGCFRAYWFAPGKWYAYGNFSPYDYKVDIESLDDCYNQGLAESVETVEVTFRLSYSIEDLLKNQITVWLYCQGVCYEHTSQSHWMFRD